MREFIEAARASVAQGGVSAIIGPHYRREAQSSFGTLPYMSPSYRDDDLIFAEECFDIPDSWSDGPYTHAEIRALIVARPCPGDGGMGASAEFCDV